ncbi:MAG: helix-turn-helix domain-containing protein [Sphaerochaetaceae bacterium]|nr:helix-turn-helix domain-containing protein [uncultured Sphaerochaeta sp.]MDC7229690.1 helix-turn-helix domain-containing protein [Sphaerochaetaceae bacterium]
MILLTPKQTAEYLQLSEIQVRRLLAANKIPHFKIGRVNRVNQEELDAWLMKRARQEAVGSFKQKR